MGPPGRPDQEWIQAIHICPIRRQRADASLGGLSEEDPVLAPGVGEPNQFELAPLQRVERMRDTESLRTAAVTRS